MKNGIYLTPGAARTAYYVGALHTLMTESQLHFDVIASSSVGSLNGAYAAMRETETLVEIWRNWTTDEVMKTDYGAILKGGFFWAKNFSSNVPEYRSSVRDYIFEDKISDDVIFRFNIANLTTGENRIVQYPGEDIPLQKAVMASVSVPVVFEPIEIDGQQYVDGLAIEGCLLEELILSTGVDRVFVLGVSPEKPIQNPTKSPYSAIFSASEWNQYTEPLIAIDNANEVNEIIRNWKDNEQSLKQTIGELQIGETEKNLVQSMIEDAVESTALPYKREPVEIIPVMPEEPIDMWFGDFKPERSRRLIDMGTKDMRAILENHKL